MLYRSSLVACLPLLILIGGTPFVPTIAFGEEINTKEDRNLKAEAKIEVDKAQLHYKLGRFEEALAAYIRAYELFNAPALLFNIGQCHKNLQNHARAIFFFEGYLREETNPERRALAEDLVAKTKAELLSHRFEPRTPSPPVLIPSTQPSKTALNAANAAIDTDTVLPPADIATSSVGDPASGPSVLVDTSAPPPPKPITKKWWFWTAIGAGIFAATGGALAYYGSGQTTTIQPSGSVGTLDRR